MKQKDFRSKSQINKIEVTKDTLTGRGGMVLYERYLSEANIYPLFEDAFGYIRKSMKGLAVWKIFKQVFCFFADGTSRHLTYFDELKKDEGYAGVIENKREEMVSSHQVKRFFKAFSWLCGGMFRKILRRLFIWRLRIKKPNAIVATIDTMVMDNDEAEVRHGVQPTYKNVKGFQPLHIIWGRKIVDAIFRGGKKHSNYGNTVVNMVEDFVKLIREGYSATVPIILRLDSGFFDEINFKHFEELGIGFICTGKMYKGVKEYVESQKDEKWGRYENDKQEWEYKEFGFRCDSWDKFYRAIYTKPLYEGEQRVFDFARPDNVIITNIGINSKVLASLSKTEQEEWEKAEAIIKNHHQRGGDELPHRGIKDFGFEELPFKMFSANTAFYYCMVIAFFLFESFKEDVLEDVIPIGSYATTVRRKVLDIAAKIVKTGGEIILRVTKTVMESLRFDELWERCRNPIPI